jgi:hypothetical protein
VISRIDADSDIKEAWMDGWRVGWLDGFESSEIVAETHLAPNERSSVLIGLIMAAMAAWGVGFLSGLYLGGN